MDGIYLGLVAGANGPVTYKGDRHLTCVGPNGSGKGSRLLTQNLMYLTNRSMIVLDVKGELACMTAEHRARDGEVVTIDPFCELQRIAPHLNIRNVGYNPLALLDPTSPDFPDDCKEQAEALIELRGNDPHWPESAQICVAAAIMYECLENGQNANYANVLRLITEPTLTMALFPGGPEVPIAGFGYTVQQMVAYGYPALAARAGRLCRDSDEIASIVSAAVTQLDFLNSIPIANSLSHGGFDFGELKERPITVYLVIPSDRLETHGKWVKLILDMALKQLKRRSNTTRPRVLFAMDEVAQLGNFSLIPRAFGIARGFDCQMLIVLQSLKQLEDHYGKGWELMIGGSGVLFSFAPRDWFTAEFISKMSGQTTQWIKTPNSGTSTGERHNSQSQGMAWSPYAVPLIRPEEVMALPDGAAICLLAGLPHPVLLACPDYREMPNLRGLVGTNPYYHRRPPQPTNRLLGSAAPPLVGWQRPPAMAALPSTTQPRRLN